MAAAPQSLTAVRGVYTARGSELNTVLAQTAKMSLVFSLLLALGILAGTGS